MQLRLTRQSLLYDIANYAYIAGHRIETESGDTALAHLLTDICAAGNIDRVSRVLALVHASIYRALNPSTDISQCPLTDDIYDPDIYIINVADGLPAATYRHLLYLIHEYMVYRAIADWMSIIHEAYSTQWADKASAIASEIASAICTHPHRRRPQP